MHSVKVSQRKSWMCATARFVIAISISVSLLGPGVGWPQEHSQLEIDEELAKQEKIYRSRGDQVPSGYITSRALSDYVALLPSGFCSRLASLGNSDRWLDIGAGRGDAILEYYSLKRCARPGIKAKATAMSIEDRRTEGWKILGERLGADRLRYVTGKPLRHYSVAELGTFQLITDVYGGFSYTEDLSKFVETVLSLLETDGAFYSLLQSVRLEDTKDDPEVAYQTELVDASGNDVKVCSWLKKISCVNVNCESKSDWSPSALIHIRKVCSDVSVPRMNLLQFTAGNPPNRRFQLDK